MERSLLRWLQMLAEELVRFMVARRRDSVALRRVATIVRNGERGDVPWVSKAVIPSRRMLMKGTMSSSWRPEISRPWVLFSKDPATARKALHCSPS